MAEITYREQNRIRQQQRRSQGLCVSCSNSALPDKRRCQECTDDHRSRERERYRLKVLAKSK